MASINVRKDSGKLYLDFRYRNIRCREQTKLTDSPANRKKLGALLQKIEAEILLGTFDYETTFPASPMLKKLAPIKKIEVEQHTTPLFKEFAQLWFKELKVQWRESYTNTVSKIIELRLTPTFGNYPVDKITKSMVLQFRSDLAEVRKKNGETFSPSHINRHLKILKAILNEAADRFSFRPQCNKIKSLHVPKSDINPFRPEEIALILEKVRDDFKDYFTVRFFTGLRTGEIDGLKWRYVDFERRLIYVRETIVEGREQYTKNDFSQRDIQMNELVYQALKRMQEVTGQFTYVFVNQNGNPFDHNSLTKRVWYPLLSHLGIEKRNPYQIRHTAATL